MASVKYVDIPAIVQVIGGIYNQPNLIENEAYFFTEEDFTEEFHKIIFGSIYNLFKTGAKEITPSTIEDYLLSRPKKLAIYKQKKGEEYLQRLSETTQLSAFDYYYNRMKKMTLLRMYQKAGMNLSWLYDIDTLDVKKKQAQEDWLDNTSLQTIADMIDDKIAAIRNVYVDDVNATGAKIGDGIDELLESLSSSPAYGIPLYGRCMNTVTRGARLGKFYLRSAATGVGKSRSMIADACFIGCSYIYDIQKNDWIYTNEPKSVLYIATEQDLSEVQTMCLAFLAAVDEEHILTNTYTFGERERVLKAAQLLKDSKIHFECTPDFSLLDIENMIKRHIRENQIEYCFYDYIHTSMKILEEVTKRSGGVRLREDNILFMLSTKLKEICVKYNIFILSSTQLSGDWKTTDTPDQNLLRGAKAIADRIDWGSILLEVTSTDMEKLEPILSKGMERPNVKLSIYKNRQGRWKGIYLWMKADRGICRFDTIFATKYDYELIEMEDLKIKVEENNLASAF